MKRSYSRNYNNGHFASRDVLSKRMRKEEIQGKIIAFVVVFGVIVVFLVGLHGIAVWGRTEAHRAWDRVVSWQVELKEKAEYIAWRDVPVAEASEPLPFVRYVPEIVPKEIAGEFAEYAEKYNVPKDKMARIMMAESSFNPNAKNVNKDKTVDRGYCQQNDYHWKKKIEKAGLVYGSLQACFWIYSIAGDAPWYASKNKWAY